MNIDTRFRPSPLLIWRAFLLAAYALPDIFREVVHVFLERSVNRLACSNKQAQL